MMTANETVVDVSQDWLLAGDVQQRFMQGHGRVIDSLDYSARCRQAQAIGGDCYDFLPLGDGRMGFAIGDASGKGLAAALMIANVQSSLRTAAIFAGNDLPAFFAIVNRQAYASSLADRFATLFFGVFDGITRTLRYVNAGHNPPIVVEHDGPVSSLEKGGAPIGMFPDSRYEEGSVELQPGSCVIAYTDGVVEASNRRGESWGMEGLLQAACAGVSGRLNAEAIVHTIFNSMDDFSEGKQSDDATLAVLQVS